MNRQVLRPLLKTLRKLLQKELSKAKRRSGSKGSALTLVVVLTIAVFAIDYFLKEPDLPIPDPGSDLVCELRSVADGDTVTLGCENGRLKVRVWGIDAPETGQKPWGQEAKEFLQYLLPDGAISVQVVDTDRYGRSVARLFAGDEDLGLSMVREGKAVVYRQYNDSNAYSDAEREARAQGLGIWSEPGSQQDPAAWRKVNARQ